MTTTGTLAATIGQTNPIRYRGYYYDTESGLYYLQSRYYDPVVGRFINADGIIGINSNMATNNLFAYCGNNPINRTELYGQNWFTNFISGIVDKAVNSFENFASDYIDKL